MLNFLLIAMHMYMTNILKAQGIPIDIFISNSCRSKSTAKSAGTPIGDCSPTFNINQHSSIIDLLSISLFICSWITSKKLDMEVRQKEAEEQELRETFHIPCMHILNESIAPGFIVCLVHNQANLKLEQLL